MLLAWTCFSFIAAVTSAERPKKYVYYKVNTEFPEGPFSILYMYTTAQKDDNLPGMTILRWIYEDLPADIKDRLQVLYFFHPGLRSGLAFATLGRFFLSGNIAPVKGISWHRILAPNETIAQCSKCFFYARDNHETKINLLSVGVMVKKASYLVSASLVRFPQLSLHQRNTITK